MFLSITFSLFMTATDVAQALTPVGSNELELGRRIYNEGTLASGKEIVTNRSGNAHTSVACVNCHRRSGMGQVEGDVMIPPITGNFLFASRSEKRLANMDPHVSKLFNQSHEPYTDDTLAKAIVQGVNNQGQDMSVLMPRYNLNDQEIKSLTVYLKQLSLDWSPGVTQSSIRFATVITPEVDSTRRQVMIDMVKTIVNQKNGSTMTATQNTTRHHMTSAAEMVLGTERHWELDVWELQGPPETWEAQLSAYYHKNPVFAIISGLSDSSWQPVQDFCEQESVPCMFPSVSLPGNIQSPYTFYFSGGVKLESSILARHLLDQKSTAKHLVQIYRDDKVGQAAAKSLTEVFSGTGIKVTNQVLSSVLPIKDALRKILSQTTHDDVVMFWLNPEDIESLGKLQPVSDENYFSGFLAKGEHAPLTAAWNAHSYLVYPYDLPENRMKNLDYFHAWLNIRKLPLVDEAMQSEVFFAMNFMTDTLAEMLDNVYRDYLVERTETMLSKREGAKSAQETRDRVVLGRVGDLVKRHGALTTDKSQRISIGQQGLSLKNQGTTLYPHLNLAAGQRYASKSGYIVRLTGDSDHPLDAISPLITP